MTLNAKRYDFHDEWEINAPLLEAWSLVSDSAHWQKWWPGLVRADVIKEHPNIVGNTVRLTWRSTTGYRLTHTVKITGIESGHFYEFESSGDMEGYGTWNLSEQDDLTKMVIDWHVTTTKTWMNVLAPLLRPIFISNHKSLMKAGERGLNNFLIAKNV